METLRPEDRLATFRKGRAWLLAVVVVGLLAAACSSGDGDSSGSVEYQSATTVGSGDAYDAEASAGAEGESATAGSGGADENGDSSGTVDFEPATTAASREVGAVDELANDSADMAIAPAAEADGPQYATAPLAATPPVASTGASVAAPDGDVVIGPPPECRECEPNTFEDYGVNPFVVTSEDALSTFALDVDTASYVVTRNFLDGGQLPPTAAVRVEEFVNYFDGGYEPVIDDFNISVDAAPTPFSDPGRVMMRVGVQAPQVLSDVVTPDSVVLVLDRSGSMGEPAGYADRPMARINLVHEAVELLVAGLPRESRVGVVAYHSVAETVLEPTAVSGNADWIADEVRWQVGPGGTTNAEAGLVRGYEMALSEAQQGRSVLVLLMSDGVANVGATRTSEILEEIGERGDIGLSTVGVGLGPFNDALMEQLANTADGTYRYIDTFDEARRIFGTNLDGLLSLAARDAKIQVEFNPDKVVSYRLLGFENRDVADEDFRNDIVDAGEVGVGQSSTALYEVTLAEGWDIDAGPIATVSLRYRRPASEQITETSVGLLPGDVGSSFDSAGARFRLAVVAAEFAEVLRKSPFVSDPTMEALAVQAGLVAEDLSNDDDASELARLIDIAAQLTR